MDLYDYFETTEGRGVLATADSAGKVDVAIYSRPHVMADGSIAFIMRDRLSHKNLETNPHAAYLFIEKDRMAGKRFFLTKIREEQDMETIKALRRRRKYPDDGEKIFLVHFTIDKERPLVGQGKE